MIQAKIIADSIVTHLPERHRLTSLEVDMPRIVLAEFNTHRILTRNSASSRAIPAKKMIRSVREKPFIPIAWQKEHTGMQGTEYITDENEIITVKARWLAARNDAVFNAIELNKLGVTKQLTNRLLEPFMMHRVLVSATEWENFMALRHHPDAEIHIQAVAVAILEEMNANTPRELKPGEWHIPYGESIDGESLEIWYNSSKRPEAPYWSELDFTERIKYGIQIATALCAGVSYIIVGEDGKLLDYTKLIERHDRLAAAGHWSPFEHCARAMTIKEYLGHVHSEVDYNNPEKIGKFETGWSGNFRGFIQYRKMFQNENRHDSRLLKK